MVFFSRFYFVHFIVEWIGLRFFAIQINSSANLHRASNMSSYINQYYFLREFPLTYHDTNQLWNHYLLRTFLRSHFFLKKKIMNFIKSNSVKMKVAAPKFNESNHINCTGKCTEDFCASTTISFLLGLLHFFRLFYYYSLWLFLRGSITVTFLEAYQASYGFTQNLKISKWLRI